MAQQPAPEPGPEPEPMTQDEYEDWKALQEVLDERAAEWWRENQEESNE